MDGRERGVALVEATIVLGLLVMILLTLFDLYFLNATYVNLSQFAREGVMTGSGMPAFTDVGGGACDRSWPDLHKNQTLPQDSYYTNCKGADPSTCGHYVVQWRIELLMNTLNLSFVDKANRHITTTCISPTEASPGTFKVEISIPFRGFTPIFRNSILRVSQFGLVR